MKSEKLSEMFKVLESAAAAYATAMNNREPKKVRDGLKKAMTKAVNDYNVELANETYRAWKAQGDPVKTMVRERYIQHAKSVRVSETDTGDYAAVISDKLMKADPYDMAEAIGDDVFAKSTWYQPMERLAFIIAANLNEHLSNSAGFAYGIREATKAFNFPPEVEAESVEAVIIALQQTIDSILFLPDPEKPEQNMIHLTLGQDRHGLPYNREWTVIRESMTRAGKDIGTVDILNTAKMAEYVIDAMHTNLTKGDFIANAV